MSILLFFNRNMKWSVNRYIFGMDKRVCSRQSITSMILPYNNHNPKIAEGTFIAPIIVVTGSVESGEYVAKAVRQMEGILGEAQF